MFCHRQVITLEMETFHLFDLARSSGGSVVAAAAAIGLAQRKTNDFLHKEVQTELELKAGLAVLRALAGHPLSDPSDDGKKAYGDASVW